jgi:hypothetical protein
MSDTTEENKPTQQITTIRFSLPLPCTTDVIRTRLIGNDLLVYVPNDKAESVTTVYTDIGFTRVDRVFKLHVSSQSKEAFLATFGDIEYEDRSIGNRFIATVIAKTEDEYNKMLTFGNDEKNHCRVKPYRPRFAISSENLDPKQTNYARNETTKYSSFDKSNTRPYLITHEKVIRPMQQYNVDHDNLKRNNHDEVYGHQERQIEKPQDEYKSRKNRFQERTQKSRK